MITPVTYMRVLQTHKKSQARYAAGVKNGSILKVAIPLITPQRGSNGTRGLSIDIHLYSGEGDIRDDNNYTHIASITHREFFSAYRAVNEPERNKWEPTGLFTVEQIPA